MVLLPPAKGFLDPTPRGLVCVSVLPHPEYTPVLGERRLTTTLHIVNLTDAEMGPCDHPLRSLGIQGEQRFESRERRRVVALKEMRFRQVVARSGFHIVGEHEFARLEFGNQIFKNRIPKNIRLEEAHSRGLSIFEHAPKSKGALAYALLVEKVLHG